MSIATFIPEVWSAQLLVALRKNLVYSNLVNRDYEGEIAQAGDTVHINSVGDPVIRDYDSNTPLTYQDLTTADRTLVIDQAKEFDFKVDDVDKRQAAGTVLGEGMSRAAYGLADKVDQYIAAQYTGAAAQNQVGETPIITADDAYKAIVRLRRKLNEANVPTDGRFVVIPPWVDEIIGQDARFTNAFASGEPSAAVTGFVKKVQGFDVLVSNNVPNPEDDDWVIIAGNNAGITYAEQLNEVEALRLQGTIADAVRGLLLFGAKLVRPQNVATLIASQT